MSYRRAGVDIEGADRWLGRMAGLIRTTRGPNVLRDLGSFGGLYRLGGRWTDPVLVASTDGVGTKLHVAQLAGRHEGIGVDLVAMNVNDVLVYGAQPLFFLDYLAVGRLAPRIMTQLVRGVVRGCRQSGCALLGGETAEMPGTYGRNGYDVAGFCVGVVERRRIIDGSGVRRGDTVLGLASSGPHANGFSLIRKVFSQTQLRRCSRQLLAPTRIYVKPVLALAAQVPVHALAHVTGGGLARRLPSLVARRRWRVRLRPGSWRVPPIFGAIQRAGRISDAQMAQTFNMGIGMALVCRSKDAGRALRLLRAHRTLAWQIGVVE